MIKPVQTPFSQTILECAQDAVADAMETHRRMGRSVVVWRDGKVAHIRPEEIAPRALPGDEKEKN